MCHRPRSSAFAAGRRTPLGCILTPHASAFLFARHLCGSTCASSTSVPPPPLPLAARDASPRGSARRERRRRPTGVSMHSANLPPPVIPGNRRCGNCGPLPRADLPRPRSMSSLHTTPLARTTSATAREAAAQEPMRTAWPSEALLQGPSRDVAALRTRAWADLRAQRGEPLFAHTGGAVCAGACVCVCACTCACAGQRCITARVSSCTQACTRDRATTPEPQARAPPYEPEVRVGAPVPRQCAVHTQPLAMLRDGRQAQCP